MPVQVGVVVFLGIPMLLSKIDLGFGQQTLAPLQAGISDPATWALTTAVLGALFMAFLAVGIAFIGLRGTATPDSRDREP